MAKSLVDGETERESGRERFRIFEEGEAQDWGNFSSKCGLFWI